MPSLPTQGLQNIIPLLAGFGTAIQLIVLAGLLLTSVVCWAIILQKSRLYRQVRRHNAHFLDAYYSGNDLTFVAAAARRFAFSPLARVFRAVQQKLGGVDNGHRLLPDQAVSSVPAAGREHIRHLLQRAQREELHRLERGLSFLATTAGVAPFVGLLGTVWGIMQSFHAIGQRGGATLAVVGPGISEALVATAAGLAAAIPAVVAYNHYLNRLRRLEAELEGFTEELTLLFEYHLSPETPQPSSRVPLRRS